MTLDLSLITDSNVRDMVAEYADSVDVWGITRPGKFESSPLWTVYYYAWMMMCEGEPHYTPCLHEGSHAANDDDELICDCESEVEYTSFEISDVNTAIFPDLAGHKYACLTNESSGHVSGYTSESVDES